MDNQKLKKTNSLLPGIVLCITITAILVVHCLFTTYAVATIECKKEANNSYCEINDQGISKNRFEKILIASIDNVKLETKSLRNITVSRIVIITTTGQIIPVNSSFSSDEFAHMEAISNLNIFLKDKKLRRFKFVDDSRMDAIKRTLMGVIFIVLIFAVIMLIKFRKKLFNVR